MVAVYRVGVRHSSSAVVILSDAGATIAFNGFAQELPQSPTILRYAILHLATGAVLLAGAVSP